MGEWENQFETVGCVFRLLIAIIIAVAFFIGKWVG